MSQSPDKPLCTAKIIWDEQGLPASDQYQDMYFSIASGLDESRYVFIQHNKLTARWKNMSDGEHFTIGETGFGTGLNFLATWQHWRQQVADQQIAKNTRLHFISAEKHPLQPQDLAKSLALWPELKTFSQQLVSAYPPPCPGSHRLVFDQGQVTLTLLMGEANKIFQQLEGQVDAWYLDGFSPPKNPDMWNQSLFDVIGQKSHQSTTFSTFTAASAVRRSLEVAGFKVERASGFGKKREMYWGQFQRAELSNNERANNGILANDQPINVQPEDQQANEEKPATITDADKSLDQQPWNPSWYASPTPTVQTRAKQHAIILGAGLAGCSAARALADRGWQVEVIDQGHQAATGASGNAQGILYAKLPAKPTLASRIHLAGYLFSLQRLKQLLPQGNDWQASGVLQLALSDKDREKQLKLQQQGWYPEELVQWVDAKTASELAGLKLEHDGLFFPQGGWVNPPALCQAMLDHANITTKFNQPIMAIQRINGGWQTIDKDQQSVAEAPILIVATAHHALQFNSLNSLPLKAIRGQVSQFSQASAPELNTVLCGNSYISPARHGELCFGATFDLNDIDETVRDDGHQQNIEHTSQLSPSIAQALSKTPMDQRNGRVGFRCAAPDYLPLIGAIPNREYFINTYAELRNNAKAIIPQRPQHEPGLFVSLGHGSKGLITAPLAAEILACQLCGEPLPLEKPLLNALNPARFIIKDLIRRAI